jgi:hypothetical protein
MISELERSELMEVLERAAGKLLAGEDLIEPDPEWTTLVTEVLELPIAYFPAVQAALVQGRWRNAKNPKAYLRTVVRREIFSMGSEPDAKRRLRIPSHLRNEEGKPLSMEEYLDLAWSDTGPVKESGVWKARNPMEEAIWVDEEDRVIPVVNGRPVSLDLLMLADNGPDARLVVNWDEVARRAGRDADETQILKLRAYGLTREFIFTTLAQQDEDERRRWQAAWRRLDRHMDTVRAVLAGSAKKI